MESQAGASNLVDVNVLGADAARLLLALRVAVLVELKVAVAVALGAVRVRLVDLGRLGQLAVGLEGAGLVGRVLEDHVALVVLVVAEGEEDDVALVDPDLFAELCGREVLSVDLSCEEWQ